MTTKEPPTGLWPLSEETLKAMPEAAWSAIVPAAGACTVALATDCVDDRSAGSGVLVRIAEDSFLFTAGHCASCVEVEGRWLAIACPKGPPVRLGTMGLAQTTPTAEGHKHDHTDVAVFHLSGEQHAALLKGGHDFLRISSVLAWYDVGPWPPVDVLVPYGYPDDARQFINDLWHLDHRALTLHHADPTGLKDFDHRAHIAMAYPNPLSADPNTYNLDGAPAVAIHPIGFSGGGVWRLPLRKLNRWENTDAHLVGISTEFEPGRMRARCTKVGVLLSLVLRLCPNLADPLRILQPGGVIVPYRL